MLFPISDDDRLLTSRSYVTYALILANIVVFVLFQQGGLNEAFTAGFSAIPKEIINGIDLVDIVSMSFRGEVIQIRHYAGPSPIYLTLITSMFMHGGLMHLGGNMLYLWIFGDNIEHRFGSAAFLAFYLVAGLAASATQIALEPDSIIPTLGASGAISGVLGAYLVLFPKNKVNAIFFFYVITIPAFVALGAWILMQLVEGFGTLGGGQLGGVAYGAHIGGFVAGAFLAMILRVLIREERPNVYTRNVPPSSRKRLW